MPALSETDDSWQGRLQALVVTLLCFASASFVVQWLFPWPWLFAAGLAVSTFTLIMLGRLASVTQPLPPERSFFRSTP
ncbi:hypothetical protein HAALTHF_10770n [Vreelandella aquamarina]|nr:hypothetical protein HAALTHF_10770n [Halomonas axialensis]